MISKQKKRIAGNFMVMCKVSKLRLNRLHKFGPSNQNHKSFLRACVGKFWGFQLGSEKGLKVL
jgi:hypothetical protein